MLLFILYPDPADNLSRTLAPVPPFPAFDTGMMFVGCIDALIETNWNPTLATTGYDHPNAGMMLLCQDSRYGHATRYHLM